jgi:hypothetical protein
VLAVFIGTLQQKESLLSQSSLGSRQFGQNADGNHKDAKEGAD